MEYDGGVWGTSWHGALIDPKQYFNIVDKLNWYTYLCIVNTLWTNIYHKIAIL